MSFTWALLPCVLLTGAAAMGSLWAARYEQRSGKALRFFVAHEPWSRERNPATFKLRQTLNWLFTAFLGMATLAFFVRFMGLVDAPN